MSISVVVSTFNRREIVTRTLQSLFAQTLLPYEFEIIVVVDGSTDGTAETLRGLTSPCRLRVHERTNGGLAAARNSGLHLAEHPIVLFLDDDMLCAPELVALHLEAHKKHSGIAAFGAIFLSPDSPPGLAAECFRREIGEFHLHHQRSPGRSIKPEECVFSNASVSRATLLALGGFDDQFRMREDLEFGVRLFAAGVTPHYLERAITWQYYSKSCADLIRDAERFAIADFLYEYKHPGENSVGHVRLHQAQLGWKQFARKWLAHFPLLADALLTPFCFLGEQFIRVSVARNLGVRALQIRRRIHWLHKVLELERERDRDTAKA